MSTVTEPTKSGLESQNTPTTDPTTPTPPKIEFNEEQQAHINRTIDKRFSTIAARHEQEKKTLEEQLQAALDEVEKMKKKPTKKEGEEDPDAARKAEIENILNNEREQTKQAKRLAEQRLQELERVTADSMRIKKSQAIRDASKTADGKDLFLDMDVVMAMSSDKVEYDEPSKAWVVRENGIIRQNSSLDTMTLAEYFQEFAQKRPFLAHGEVVGGAGSSESRGGGHAMKGVVRSKADLKTIKEKSQYLQTYGLDAFEKLPLK